MNTPRLFVGLACIALALPIAAAVFTFSVTPLGYDASKFLPPSAVFNYQPPASSSWWFGDYLWGVAMTMMWLLKTPQIFAEMMALFGVPPIVASALSTLAIIGMASFIIYIIANRIPW
jgi:hypothetical protein